MHQGNLLICPNGTFVAIDLGIMGRLDPNSRRFLAEILYGFITRDYRRVAQTHFDAGYVPDSKSMEAFAQALRAIGEPIRGQDADSISMGRVLTQLFEVTEQFDMQTQPQLLLLQKTMVVVEGVARSFDPKLNIWDAADPVVSGWIKGELGPEAILKDAVDGVQRAAKSIGRLPDTLERVERNQEQLEKILSDKGFKIHYEDERKNILKPWLLISSLALGGYLTYRIFQ
jgi:ubiquinone biosynthesis protein